VWQVVVKWLAESIPHSLFVQGQRMPSWAFFPLLLPACCCRLCICWGGRFGCGTCLLALILPLTSRSVVEPLLRCSICRKVDGCGGYAINIMAQADSLKVGGHGYRTTGSPWACGGGQELGGRQGVDEPGLAGWEPLKDAHALAGVMSLLPLHVVRASVLLRASIPTTVGHASHCHTCYNI